MKRYMRYIDRVTLIGQDEPIGLYTIDMDVENLPPSKDPDQYPEDEDRKEFLNQKKLELTYQLL